jgi:integrase
VHWGLPLDNAIHIDDGLMVFSREGIYQMRLKVAPQRYVWRSLKTRNKKDAILAAKREFYRAEFAKEDGGSYAVPTLKKVLAEYTAQREVDFQRGKIKEGMLRQIKRVQKFWIEFAGTKPVDKIGNKELEDFVEWRIGYYSRMKTLPKNAALHPADKTLQWEVTFGKTIIKWAHGKGYRGSKQLPTYSYVPKKKRVRPAFEIWEYKRLYETLRKRTHETKNPAWLYTRLMLRDYVLILANSGLRVGELNNMSLRDIHPFKDNLQRENYRLIVRGKTGERDVIIRASAKRWVDRAVERRRKMGAGDNDWFFAMHSGSKIITLADQITEVLKAAGLETNAYGEAYSLYSLRHFYAVQSLRRGKGVFEVARNMGTSVEMLQTYYGKSATASKFATGLGD